MMMPGQGKPLPDFLQCNGEWVFEGRLFIYHADETPSISMTMGAERHDGEPCIGIPSDRLAAELGVSNDELIEANKAGLLEYLGEAQVPSLHGGLSATAYGFRLGEMRGMVTVEISQEGQA